MKKIGRIFLGLIGLVALGLQPGAAELSGDAARDELRYNRVWQKSSHNSYHKVEDVESQIRFHQVRTVEFDVHIRRPAAEKREMAPAGDWFTYHGITDLDTNCYYLSECFGKLRAYHDAEPDHQVITVFFDVNELAPPHHTKADFYNLVSRIFPPASVLRPADLTTACPGAENLQQAVTNPGCGWPRLRDLRGQFILVISGGDNLFRQGSYDLDREWVFLAAYRVTSDSIPSDPNLIFFNFRGPLPFARAVYAQGFVSRTYVINTPEAYRRAREYRTHLLATDRINVADFPWTAPGPDPAWPFGIIER